MVGEEGGLSGEEFAALRRYRDGAMVREADSSAKRMAVAAALAHGATTEAALATAGYSPKNRGVVSSGAVREAVAVMRERLQRTPGYTLEESVEFYRKMSENEDVAPGIRISARKEMDARLGYNAPTKVEVNERKSLCMAVEYLNSLPERPSELLREVSLEEAGSEAEIEPCALGHEGDASDGA
jgi:hypothetical protein